VSDWKFSRVRDVQPLQRGSREAVGFDVFLPVFNTAFHEEFTRLQSSDPSLKAYLNSFTEITIPKHSAVLIPSGLKFKFPSAQMLMSANRSGIATKKGLRFGAHIVDPDYQGEYLISLFNSNDFPVLLQQGMKILQIIRVPVLVDEPEEVKLSELYSETSGRGSGGFGSTGN